MSVIDTSRPLGESREEMLRLAIERARRSAFYAQHLEGRDLAGGLASLPLTEKHHLQAAGPFGMLAVPPSQAWHYHESSGTTGEPISTWCGLPELERMAELVCEFVPELAREAILLNRFPLFAPVAFVFEEALRRAGACHIAAGNMTWDVPFDRAIGFIRRLGATALASLPLEPILLAELARDLKLDVKEDLGSIEVILLGGAVLPPALREAIEEDWAARVVEVYGSNETMLMGLGCTSGRLHLCTELLEFEVLDPATLAPVAAGEAGLMTVTSLVHEVMPLVRYVTGDLVRLHLDPCACGRAGPTAQVLGRFEERIEYDGVATTSFEITDAAYEFAATLGTRIFFVLVQRRSLHVLVEVEDPGAVSATAAETRLRARLGVPVEVEYVARGDVLDRSALTRTPKIYKPSVISDWRGDGRKTITIMEALLEWPRFDARTLGHLLRRLVRTGRRRRRLVRGDRYAGD